MAEAHSAQLASFNDLSEQAFLDDGCSTQTYPIDLDCIKSYYPTLVSDGVSSSHTSHLSYNLNLSGFDDEDDGKKVRKVSLISNWIGLPFALRKSLQAANFTQPRGIQSHMWSYLLEHLGSALLIGPPKTGKSLAYLIPVIGFLVRSRESENKAPSMWHQSVLIVCSDAFKAEKLSVAISGLIDDLIDPPTTLLVSCLSKLDQSKRIRDALDRDIDIIITTPWIMLQMHNNGYPIFATAEYLIFDDADVCFTVHLESCKEIYLRYTKFWADKLIAEANLADRTVTHDDVICAAKTIIVGEEYTREIHTFHVEFQLPRCLQVFGDLFELALKNGIDVAPLYCNESDKKMKILMREIKRAREDNCRMMVSCVSDDQVEYVSQYLRELNPKIAIKSFTKKTNQAQHSQSIHQHWQAILKHQDGGALIISDECLHLFISIFGQLCNCDTLFHYSLPKEMRTFSIRFNLMNKSIGKSPDLRTVILISQLDNWMVRHWIKLFRRLGAEPPVKLIQDVAARGKVYCTKWSAFGKCPLGPLLCLNDHEIDESQDNSPSLPTVGQVKFEILNVTSPNELVIKLLAHRRSDFTWSKLPDRQEEISKMLDSIVASQPAPVTECVHVGNYFLALMPHGKRRIKIENVINATVFRAFEVDGGKTLERVQKHQLRHLTREAERIPPLAIKCFVTGIAPIFNSANWSAYAHELIRYWLTTKQISHVTAWIHLAVANRLWIYDVLFHTLSSNRLTLYAGKLEDELIDKKFAEICPKIKHPLANDESMREVTILKWNVHTRRKSYSWAFLRSFENVFLMQVRNFDEIYLRIVDWDGQLANLEDMMSKAPFKPLKYALPNLACVYRFKVDGETVFNRVMTLSSLKTDPSTAIQTVDVFFLDYGEFKCVPVDDLSVLRSEHLTYLPFQAIRCSLQAHDQLTQLDPEKLADMITRKVRGEDNMLLNVLCKKLSSQSVEENSPESLTCCKIYSVQIFLNQEQLETPRMNTYHSLESSLIAADKLDEKDVLKIEKPQIDDEFYEEDEVFAKARESFLAFYPEYRMQTLNKFYSKMIPRETLNRIPSTIREENDSHQADDEDEDESEDEELALIEKIHNLELARGPEYTDDDDHLDLDAYETLDGEKDGFIDETSHF